MAGGIIDLSNVSLTSETLEGGQALEATPQGNEVEKTTEETREEEEEENPETKSTETEKENSEQEQEEEEEEEGKSNENNEESEEPATIQELADEVGLPIPEGKTYENDFAGIASYLKDAKPLIIQEGAKEFFEENPEIAEFYRAKIEGKAQQWVREKAAEVIDYETTELGEETPENVLEQVIIANRKSKGLTETQINRELKRIKDADELLVEAQDAFEMDKEAKVAAKVQEAKAAKEAEAKRIKDDADYLASQKKLILSGKIGDIVIPEAERQPFFDARHKKGANGLTAIQEKIRGYSDEQLAQLDYFIMKDFKLGKVAEREANTKKANNLLARSKKSNGKSEMSGGKAAPVVNGNVPTTINTSQLIGNTI